MLKKVTKICAVITSLTLLLTACSNKTEENNKKQNNNDVLITLILDKGGVNDASFNESAWSGAQNASKELGVNIKYLESNTDADYTQNIETAMDLESEIGRASCRERV